MAVSTVWFPVSHFSNPVPLKPADPAKQLVAAALPPGPERARCCCSNILRLRSSSADSRSIAQRSPKPRQDSNPGLPGR